MQLDFLTLYVIILLNSLSLCTIWAGIVFAYRGLPGVNHWFAACVMTTAGGGLLALEGYGRAFTFGGIALVVAGFCLVWVGVRTFYGLRTDWRISAAITLVSLIAMSLAGQGRASQNVIYAAFQMIPLGLSLACLLRHG